MTQPISDPEYWRQRLINAKEMHQAVFLCSHAKWEAIAQSHREILRELIKPTDSILDCGCGWGRLLDMLPAEWNGDYLGVDLSPDFIELAKRTYPGRPFLQGDLREPLPRIYHQYDWAVLISVRPMVQRNLGGEVWDVMEQRIKQVARQMLFLEYDERREACSWVTN